MKRRVILFSLLLALPAAAQEATPAPMEPAAASSEPAADAPATVPVEPVSAEGASTALVNSAEAPAVQTPPDPLQTLLGRGDADVRERFGEPAVARREDQSAMWTYRRPGCVLFLYFKSAGREGLRVTGASAGPQRRGEPAPALDACLAEVPQ